MNDFTEYIETEFDIGQLVRHRFLPFRGVIFDVDPEFSNSEAWYESIPPDIRPHKEQPFYHLLAENEDSYYTAYVSQQNLVSDAESGPIGHPSIAHLFEGYQDGKYIPNVDNRH